MHTVRNCRSAKWINMVFVRLGTSPLSTNKMMMMIMVDGRESTFFANARYSCRERIREEQRG